MLHRFYLDGEDIAQALINAGFELRPEDCSSIKFRDVAKELTDKVYSCVGIELDKFKELVLK